MAPGSKVVYIDLTLDDEDEPQPITQPPVDPGNFYSHDDLPTFTTPPIRPPLSMLPRTQPAVQSHRPYEIGRSSAARPFVDHNPAKRRKVESGVAGQHDRRPILPPVPATKAHTPAPTIIGGADRQGLGNSSRVTTGGRIQKPAPTTKSSKIDQTIKIVRGSLLRHKWSLSHQQLKNVGSKVLKQLLDPSFFAESTKDAEELSSNYLIVLTKRSQEYTDSMVAKELFSRTVVKQSQTPVSSFSSTLPQPAPQYRSRSSARSDSSDVEEVFEGRKHPPRRYSSSPTTSLDQTLDVEYKSLNNGKRAEQRASKPPKRVQLQPSLWDKFSAPPVPKQPMPVLERKIAVVEISSYEPSKFKGVLNCEPEPPVSRRPYMSYFDREALRLGLEESAVRMTEQDQEGLKMSSAIHIDLSLEELKIIYIIAKNAKGEDVPSRVELHPSLAAMITSLLAGASPRLIATVLKNLSVTLGSDAEDKGVELLRSRGQLVMRAFLQDAVSGNIASCPQIHRLETKAKRKTAMRLSTLLLQREISGRAPFRICSGKESFPSRVTSLLEDDLVRQSEWTDCCGDISTITWTSKMVFICGATAHSDYHNMQYNKPGNLAVGSTSLDTLRAVSNHRIKRPEIAREDNAENALQSMRNTQDAWLYTSVVSTAYSEVTGLAFSASFDQTVKVWSVPEDGAALNLLDAWYHSGKVNFVVTSPYHNRVATACDVSLDSVRVYTIDSENITTSTIFDYYCGDRARAQHESTDSERWAYFPATIQWGKAENVSHLLLVGFSPRSLTGDDQDIPEDRRDTGELCLWDVNTGNEIMITSAKLQNVFEVIWHPTQPIFLAATSPCGAFEAWQTKTQIRMFGQTSNGTFIHMKALDCPAVDINELTIFPTSMIHSYVTASCTDGNTYVYDSAVGDQAIHVLNHGESLDNPLHDIDRELGDTGVKFAAWGQNKNRFYTGASDGRVKAWDVTAPPRHAFVKDVLVVSGGVSAGAFSADYSQLLIGDATGKVHLLSIDDNDILEIPPLKTIDPLQAKGRHLLRHGGLLPSGLKRPKVVIPHSEPTPPIENRSVTAISDEQTGPEIARQLVENGIVQIHPDRWIGAIQARNYLDSTLFRTEAHVDNDGSAPLLPEWQAKQRSNLYIPSRRDLQVPTLKAVPLYDYRDLKRHQQNQRLDLQFSTLSLETKIQMQQERWELDWEHTYAEELSPGDDFEIFKSKDNEDTIQDFDT